MLGDDVLRGLIATAEADPATTPGQLAYLDRLVAAYRFRRDMRTARDGAFRDGFLSESEAAVVTGHSRSTVHRFIVNGVLATGGVGFDSDFRICGEDCYQILLRRWEHAVPRVKRLTAVEWGAFVANPTVTTAKAWHAARVAAKPKAWA